MSNDTSLPDQQPATERPGPGFAPPLQPVPQPVPASAPPPAAYGGQPAPPQPVEEEQQHWTPEGLVSTTVPVLPPERVGKGALLSLLAVPAGVLVAVVIAMLGFIASLSGLVVAAGAAALYVRGSGGRIKRGIPVIAVVILLGVVASFFAVVAVDLYRLFPQVDPDVAASYPSRGSFVAENLFYPPVLGEYVRTGVLLALFGVLGAFGTILRLVRMNASLQG